MTMTYRGTVKNGVVVFDGSVPLADGTSVEVAPVRPSGSAAQATTRAGSRQSVLDFAARWDGPPGEVDRLLRDVQQMRDEDVEFQRRRDAVNGQLPP